MRKIIISTLALIAFGGGSFLVPCEYAPVYAQSCCKVCKKGKACGNSCIAKDRACKKGKGCACNG